MQISVDTQPSCKATLHEFLAPSVPHECISRYIPTGVFMYPVFNLQRKFAHLDANWTNFSQVWTFPHIKNWKPNSQSLQKTVFAQLWKKRGFQILCSQGDNCLRNMLLTVKEPVPNHASFWFPKFTGAHCSGCQFVFFVTWMEFPLDLLFLLSGLYVILVRSVIV